MTSNSLCTRNEDKPQQFIRGFAKAMAVGLFVEQTCRFPMYNYDPGMHIFGFFPRQCTEALLPPFPPCFVCLADAAIWPYYSHHRISARYVEDENVCAFCSVRGLGSLVLLQSNFVKCDCLHEDKKIPPSIEIDKAQACACLAVDTAEVDCIEISRKVIKCCHSQRFRLSRNKRTLIKDRKAAAITNIEQSTNDVNLLGSRMRVF